MDIQSLESLLTRVRDGSIEVEKALQILRDLPYEDLGYAKVDHHRGLRKGFAEVVFGEGKEAFQVASIVQRVWDRGSPVMATRLSPEKAEEVIGLLPGVPASYHRQARILTVGEPRSKRGQGTILVLTGGTSDLPTAEEAAVTCEFMGHATERLYDVGVAGIHRLLSFRNSLEKANVFIVVAGMEGALPSVVAGLVNRPVIAVPSPVGYGASFGGLAALLAMLNSCADGVGVVNIGNGYGAARLACMINDGGKSNEDPLP